MWQGTQCTEQARSPVGAKSSDALSRAKQCENQGADPGCEWAMWVGLRSDLGLRREEGPLVRRDGGMKGQCRKRS